MSYIDLCDLAEGDDYWYVGNIYESEVNDEKI